MAQLTAVHVCLATPEYPPVFQGGIASYYAHLTRILAASGHRVTVLAAGLPGEDDGALAGVRVVRLDEAMRKRYVRLEAVFGPEARLVGHSAAFGLAARDWLMAHGELERIDVIEAPEFGGAAAFLVDEGLPPVAVVCHGSTGQVQAHTSGTDRTVQHDFLAALELQVVATADAVACYGRRNLAEWHDYLGRDVRYVVPPFLATEPAAITPRHDARLRAIAVGRMNNWKGILEAVEALEICRDRGLDVELSWVGRDVASPVEGIDSMVAHLRQKHPRLWGDSLRWEESLEPAVVRAEQAASDLALVPSRWDTFNFTAVEAMSVGTALVVSTGAGASDLCRDGEDALVVPPQDPQALATAIERLADPELRRRLGEAGRVTVDRELAPQRAVESRLELYGEAIERHRRRRMLSYAPSLMGPFAWQWQRALEVGSQSAAVARLPSRSLLRETLRRVGTRAVTGLLSRRRR